MQVSKKTLGILEWISRKCQKIHAQVEARIYNLGYDHGSLDHPGGQLYIRSKAQRLVAQCKATLPNIAREIIMKQVEHKKPPIQKGDSNIQIEIIIFRSIQIRPRVDRSRQTLEQSTAKHDKEKLGSDRSFDTTITVNPDYLLPVRVQHWGVRHLQSWGGCTRISGFWGIPTQTSDHYILHVHYDLQSTYSLETGRQGRHIFSRT